MIRKLIDIYKFLSQKVAPIFISTKRKMLANIMFYKYVIFASLIREKLGISLIWFSASFKWVGKCVLNICIS